MRVFKYIGIISLLIFSFYLTDGVTNLAINSNLLMQTIKENKNKYLIESVNATIESNTIIPGIKGKKVNELDSYLNMKDFGSFNTNYLIYDYYYPDITLNNNKDKIIISGNKSIRQVSFLIKNNKGILDYFKKNNLVYSKLIKLNEEFDIENINIENYSNKFNDLNTILNKNNLNKKICILGYSNIKLCKDLKYFIVKPSIELNNKNIINILNQINNGDIILIDDNLSVDNIKLVVKKINSLDIKIVYLSKIIEE